MICGMEQVSYQEKQKTRILQFGKQKAEGRYDKGL